MEYKRRDYFITFTMLGLSAAALMAYQYAGALLFGLAETWGKKPGDRRFPLVFLAF